MGNFERLRAEGRVSARHRAEQAEAQLGSTREALRELVEALENDVRPELDYLAAYNPGKGKTVRRAAQDALRGLAALTTARSHLEGQPRQDQGDYKTDPWGPGYRR